MRITLSLAVSLAFGAVASSAIADVRELDRAELRANVTTGKTMSLSHLMRLMENKVDGQIVDVRGFERGGVFYRVLFKAPDGRMWVAIVDASDGVFMPAKSNVTKDIMAAAKQQVITVSSDNETDSDNSTRDTGNWSNDPETMAAATRVSTDQGDGNGVGDTGPDAGGANSSGSNGGGNGNSASSGNGGSASSGNGNSGNSGNGGGNRR